MIEYIFGDKVVKQNHRGQLEFGQVLYASDADVGSELVAVWDNGPPEDLYAHKSQGDNDTLYEPPKIVLFDRPLPVGSKVRYLGRDGQIFLTRKVVTAYLADQNGQKFENNGAPASSLIFPRLREQLFQPVLKCKVGDSILYNGWAGQVTSGTVDVVYRFINLTQNSSEASNSKVLEAFPYTMKNRDMRLIASIDLSAVHSANLYVGMYLTKFSKLLLRQGNWSRGLRIFNSVYYRNRPAVIESIEITSLSILWVERIRPTLYNVEQPETVISGKVNLCAVFSFKNPLVESFCPNSVLMLRWNDDLCESYTNWKKFYQEIILGKEITGDGDNEEPFFKRPKGAPPFTNRDRVAVKVMFYETEVDVLFDDNSVQSLRARDIAEVISIPIISSMRLSDSDYTIGDVVKDNTDFNNINKYGFVLNVFPLRKTILVNWVILSPNSLTQVTMKEMSHYDIQPLHKFSLLKNKPQIVVAQGVFEGVVLGLSLSDAKVRIQCAEGPIKELYAHELYFLDKKVFYSPADECYEIRYIELPPDICPCPAYCKPNSCSTTLRRSITAISNQARPRLFHSAEVPWDHSYFNLIYPLQSIESRIKLESELERRVSQEIEELRRIASAHNLDLWIERFAPRPDLLTVAFIGREGTLYEEIPFLLDIWIPIEFNEVQIYYCEPPKVVVRLPRIYFPNWIHPLIQCEDGLIVVPEWLMGDWTSTPVHNFFGLIAKTVKYFAVTSLCSEPYLQFYHNTELPQFLGRNDTQFENLENNNNNEDGDDISLNDHGVGTEFALAREFNERALVTLSEYVHSLMCHPPLSWKEFIQTHLLEYLPRIYNRLSKILHEESDASSTFDLQNANLLPRMNEELGNKFLLYPISESFKLAMESRLKNLRHFLDTIRR